MRVQTHRGKLTKDESWGYVPCPAHKDDANAVDMPDDLFNRYTKAVAQLNDVLGDIQVWEEQRLKT